VANDWLGHCSELVCRQMEREGLEGMENVWPRLWGATEAVILASV
jgi:hypothetical protein